MLKSLFIRFFPRLVNAKNNEKVKVQVLINLQVLFILCERMIKFLKNMNYFGVEDSKSSL